QQVIVGELAAGLQDVELAEAGGRAVAHGERNGPVECDDGRWAQVQQRVVEADDLGPVGLVGGRCFGVNRGNGSLQAIGADIAAGQGTGDQLDAFPYLVLIPQTAVLFVQQDQVAVRRGAGRAAGILP